MLSLRYYAAFSSLFLAMLLTLRCHAADAAIFRQRRR